MGEWRDEVGWRLVSGMFEPSGVELSRHIEIDRSCSEQNRRKAVTQSYGTTAIAPPRPPGRQHHKMLAVFLLGDERGVTGTVLTHRISRRLAWERTVILLMWATMPLIGCTIPDEPVDDVVLLVNCPPGRDCNFVSSDGRVHLLIPAAAIPETGLDITAKPASNPTGSMTLVPGTARDVGPTGTTFNPRAQLSIAYDTAFVQGLAGVRESELGLYKDSSQQWHIVDSLVLDTAGTTVTAWIAGSSVYGILGAPVDTVLVSPSPAAVMVGQTLQLTAEPRSGAPGPAGALPRSPSRQQVQKHVQLADCRRDGVCSLRPNEHSIRQPMRTSMPSRARGPSVGIRVVSA